MVPGSADDLTRQRRLARSARLARWWAEGGPTTSTALWRMAYRSTHQAMPREGQHFSFTPTDRCTRTIPPIPRLKVVPRREPHPVTIRLVIQDLFLRWVVTTLFVISAAECVYGIATSRHPWTGMVADLLHALMAIAMAVMAWPRGADLPTAGPLLFFLLATVWFTAFTLGHTGHRRGNVYHCVMMLAMAWMYAVMSGRLLPAASDVASAGSGGHHGSSSMPGMNMPAVDATPEASGTPPFIAGVNWLFTIGFAVAAAWWLLTFFVRRRTEPFPSGRVQVGIAAQVMMAAGMAIMFAVTV
jgi:hypothetical protein